MLFDLQQLALLAPQARDTYRAAFTRSDLLASSGLLDAPLRLAHFLAQCCHETAGLRIVVENLNYSAERLMVVWPRRFPSLTVAAQYASNPYALANYVYGGRMGNVDPADGSRYIGRGLLQLTGRENYARIGEVIGVDLVGHPYRAASDEYALQVALAVWQDKGCDPPADADDVVRVTRAINGGLNGLADRRLWLGKAKRVLGL